MLGPNDESEACGDTHRKKKNRGLVPTQATDNNAYCCYREKPQDGHLGAIPRQPFREEKIIANLVKFLPPHVVQVRAANQKRNCPKRRQGATENA